jgi:hypothetical protein
MSELGTQRAERLFQTVSVKTDGQALSVVAGPKAKKFFQIAGFIFLRPSMRDSFNQDFRLRGANHFP